MIEISSAAQFDEYINRSSLTVVDFTAAWCGPCKAVAPRFAALAAQNKTCNFLKVDVDQNRDIASTYGVRAMPTFMVFKNGEKIDEVVGADLRRVESLIETYGSKFPSSGGHTIGGSSSSTTAGAAYVNPWQDAANIKKTSEPRSAELLSISDQATLIDLGFAESRVKEALDATNHTGAQSALNWLFAHPLPAAENDSNETAESDVAAQSLQCKDCGRLLKDAVAAEVHAGKSGHQNFSETTQLIKPLTEEEKQAKLADLRAKMATRKQEKRAQEIEDSKSREKIRRATGKELVEIKERMAEMEMKKAAEVKKREKEEERVAKQKIKAQIEADKKERHERFEKEKRERQGAKEDAEILPTAISFTQSVGGPKEYSEARIQIRLPAGGAYTQVFKSDDTLDAVYAVAAEKMGASSSSSFKLSTTFPRKVLEDKNKTLQELGLAPSAALFVS
ncbi:hypothetical protein HK100_012883 [Physocladia obscura]|uniref:Uncharacterized protein n=1 Tax=Physocladia obscura TaxID=109957 RepID=A0AAD5T0V3_9FUNG|nr:hypothetical protein HK100_012883 [Physocladia obscura]